MTDLYAPSEALADWLRLSPRRVSQLGHEAGVKRGPDGWLAERETVDEEVPPSPKPRSKGISPTRPKPRGRP